MADNSEISKQLDPAINQQDSTGEPSTSTEKGENGQTPDADNPKGLAEPNDEKVSEGETTSSSEATPTDQSSTLDVGN